MKNKFLAIVVVMAMALTMIPGVALASFTMPEPDHDNKKITADISTAEEMEYFSANYTATFHNNAAINGYTLYININADINMSGKSWTPIVFNSYDAGLDRIIMDGGNHTISNLGAMLFSGTWTGKELTIKDLTLDKAAISKDVDDSEGTVGVGAFIGNVSATETINLINCKLTNHSTVEGGHWTGGLIGYAAGYSGTDGPVFATIKIENCEVTDSTVKGKGSIGGIVGHATGDAWTAFSISGGKVSGNTITSTGSSNNKAGDVMGSVGAAKSQTTNGVTKEGSVTVNTTAANNDVKSNGVEINRIYGRFGTPGSKLSITGGNYDTKREDNSVKDVDSTIELASVGEALFAGEVDPNTSPTPPTSPDTSDDPDDDQPTATPTPKPKPTEKPASSGIKVEYNGGNSFSTSKSDVPTSVEIDGVAVPFTGDGRLFTVNSIPAGAKWVTVRWNSTSVTTNFTPYGAYAAEVEIPKTGDISLWAAVLAFFGF